VADTVWFSSAPAPPTPLATRLAAQQGTVVHAVPGDPINGELYRPAGAGPFPALVALPGCAGRLDPVSERGITERYTNRGYAVLWVDSFSARGIKHQCGFVPHPVDLALDAYGALDFLAAQPFIRPTRVIVLGVALGATTALSLASPVGFTQGISRHHFIAAIAYSPYCYPGFATVTVPTLILTGEVDSWNPAVECEAMMAQRTGAGAAEQLIVFPGAYHGFNLVGLKDQPTELFWHYMDYNEHADHAAWAAVSTFLTDLER
jgi:dienelactone hydrolase